MARDRSRVNADGNDDDREGGQGWGRRAPIRPETREKTKKKTKKNHQLVLHKGKKNNIIGPPEIIGLVQQKNMGAIVCIKTRTERKGTGASKVGWGN